MIQTGSPFAGLAKVILVIAAITLVASLALSGTDIFNFITNSTKSKIDSDRAAVDLKYYNDLKAAQTQADIDKINADRAVYLEKVKSDLAFNNTLHLVVMGVMTFASIGLFVVLLITLFRKVNHSVQPALAGKDLWQDPQKRAAEIQRARQVERAIRSANADRWGIIRPSRTREQTRSSYDHSPKDGHLN